MTSTDSDDFSVDVAEVTQPGETSDAGAIDIAVDGEAAVATVVLSGSIKTDSVRFDNLSCSGVTIKFTVPITAFGWRARLRSYNAQGGFLTQSAIVELNGSYPSGTTIKVPYGPLARGTKQLRAYIWYGDPNSGDGTMYWNLRRVDC